MHRSYASHCSHEVERYFLHFHLLYIMSGKMTPDDAARIQKANALGGGDVGKGSFPARAQKAAAKNVNTGEVPSSGGPK